MKKEDFIQASTYIRILEKRMLTRDSIDRIIDTSDPFETLKMLSQSSEYDFSSVKRIPEYEDVLKNEHKSIYDLIYKKVEENRIVIDILATKYTFHNMKVALKSKYLHKSMDYLYSNISDIDIGEIEMYLSNEEKKETSLPSYITDALNKAENDYLESNNPQDIDIVLDKEMFAYILKLCKDVNNDFITEYTKLTIDFYNIKTLMRVKNMQKNSRFLSECLVHGGITDTSYFLEHYDKTPESLAEVFFYKYFGDTVKSGIESYSKTNNFSDLEKLFDNYLIEYLKQSKYIAFGPEIVFSYVLFKENEIKQIRILVTCKNNNISNDTLRERLRDNYA